MKVIIVNTCVFPVNAPHGLAGYGGLELIAWYCARGLAAKGHQVQMVAAEGSDCPGVDIIAGGPPGHWDEKASYSKFWERLLQADVIIDHTWNKWSYILKQEGRLKAPILGVCHAPINTMYGKLPDGVDRPCFVCISKDQAAHFEALHGREARVCYNGVDLDFYQPLGMPRTDRFLFLARFSSIKGAHLAIEACQKAGACLDLVGDISITQEPDYLKKIKDMADGHQIRFVGPATRPETVYWYSRALAMLHPNKEFREPFGLAPVEAMLCGCPVVAWNYGAMKETLSEDPFAYNLACSRVRSADELTAVVRDIKELGVMPEQRANCRQWASRFSVQAMVDRYEELANEAINTGGW